MLDMLNIIRQINAYVNTWLGEIKLKTNKQTNKKNMVLDMLGSQNRKNESRMVVAKRQGRETCVKIEQRKAKGQEWEPQVEQTALLASPIYIGQAQGEEKNSFGLAHLMPQGCIFLFFLNKTEL